MTYDLDSDRSVVIDTEHFKDQRVGIYSSRNFIYPDSDEPRRSLWLSKDSKYLYFYRQSRDWHKVDVCRADTETGEVEVLFEERLNTYIDLQRLELMDNGNMVWWSERDGWAHLYLYNSK